MKHPRRFVRAALAAFLAAGLAHSISAEPAAPGWTELTTDGIEAWREPLGEWITGGNASMDPGEGKLLIAQPGQGVLLNDVDGRTTNLLSKTEHGGIEAHIEFMVPKGSNSGVYFQGRYEVQVYDSFGVAEPHYFDCGGIYQRWNDAPGLSNEERGYEGHAPSTNASRAPGEWQSFDVQFQAPRFGANGQKTENAKFIKVIHNGVVIHENVEVTGPTRSAKFEDEQPLGPLMLQGDHGPVAYRNIRIRPLDSVDADPIAAIAAYDFGQSRQALTNLEDTIRSASQEELASIEERLLPLLSDTNASFAARQFVCRVLRGIGTEKSIPALAALLTDPQLSNMARYALQPMPYPEVDDALRAALPRVYGNPKAGIIGSLGARRDAESVPQLAALAQLGLRTGDNAMSVAEAAIGALAHIGTAEAAAALAPANPVREAAEAYYAARAHVEALARAGDNERATRRVRKRLAEQDAERAKLQARLAALRADAYLQCADRLLAAGDSARAIAIYEEMSAQEQPAAIQAAANYGLAQARPEAAPELVRNLLRSGVPKLRELGAKLVPEIPGPEATQLFAGELTSLPIPAQVLLIGALSARGDKAAATSVAHAAEVGDSAVRLAAIQALAVLGDAQNVPLLIQTAAKKGEAAEAAAQSLTQLSGRGVDSMLLGQVRPGDDAARVQAIAALERRGVRASIPMLYALVNGEEATEVRAAAFQALGKLASRNELPNLVSYLASDAFPGERRVLEEAVATAARRMEDAEAATGAIVEGIRRAAAPKTQASFVAILGQLRTASALDALRAQLGAAEDEVKRAAIRALSSWNTAEPLDALLDVAENDAEPAPRVLALQGYLRLTGLKNSGTPKENTARYQKALSVAERIEEKEAAIAGLASVGTPEARAAITPCLKDPGLNASAKAALAAIDKAIAAKR